MCHAHSGLYAISWGHSLPPCFLWLVWRPFLLQKSTPEPLPGWGTMCVCWRCLSFFALKYHLHCQLVLLRNHTGENLEAGSVSYTAIIPTPTFMLKWQRLKWICNVQVKGRGTSGCVTAKGMERSRKVWEAAERVSAKCRTMRGENKEGALPPAVGDLRHLLLP